MVHLMEACLLTALQAYLLGSLLFGVLVSKLFYHDDVRLHGSGKLFDIIWHSRYIKCLQYGKVYPCTFCI